MTECANVNMNVSVNVSVAVSGCAMGGADDPGSRVPAVIPGGMGAAFLITGSRAREIIHNGGALWVYG